MTTDTYYCTSPAPRLQLPDGSLPWGGSTSSNVRCTRGRTCSSPRTSTIFFSARDAPDVWMFAGGSEYTQSSRTPRPSILWRRELTDEIVVDRGLQHLKKDGARFLRLHLQHIRDASWPERHDDPKSEYIQYFVKTVDPLLAKLIAGLKRLGCGTGRTSFWVGPRHGTDQRERSSAIGAVFLADIYGVLRTWSKTRRDDSLRRRAGRCDDDELFSGITAAEGPPGGEGAGPFSWVSRAYSWRTFSRAAPPMWSTPGLIDVIYSRGCLAGKVYDYRAAIIKLLSP